jgi:hypothetical protein
MSDFGVRPSITKKSLRSSVKHVQKARKEYDDDNMAHGTNPLFAPDIFRGSRQEDADQWLETVRHWIAFKAFDDAQRCAAFPLLLREGASSWYRELPDATKNDFDRLSRAFATRYQRATVTAWQDNAAVWTVKQSPLQSVDEYFDHIENMASKTTMPEDQKCHAIINGLRGNIRQQVLQHEGLDRQNIRKWALIAEAGETTSTEQSEVTSALKALQQQLGRLELRGLAGQEQDARRRSPSPRVHFEDDHRYEGRRLESTTYDDEEHRRRDQRAYQTYRRRDERDYRRRDEQRPSQRPRSISPPRYEPQYNSSNSPSGRWTNNPTPNPYQPPSRPFGNSRPSRNGYNTYASRRPIYGQGRDSQIPEGNCIRCLGPQHPLSRCPAQNAQCSACFRYGHWGTACRSTGNQP